MLLYDNPVFEVEILSDEAQDLQRSFGFYYFDYEQGKHLIFKSRYMAERFAIEFLGVSKSCFSCCKVTTNDGKELGYELLLAYVPIAMIYHP